MSLDLPDESRIQVEQFSGPHPAGTVGYHIHKLDPVDRHKLVWYLGYQDVVAIGELFDSGELYLDRVISLAGPMVKQPRLLRTRIGASTDALVDGELSEGEIRVISGSPLSGRIALEVTSSVIWDATTIRSRCWPRVENGNSWVG